MTHLVQVCDLLTRETRWVNIGKDRPSWGTQTAVLKAYDWAAIARVYN